jgi:hypothetical protein
MDLSRDFLEYKSLRSLNKPRNDIKEKDEFKKVEITEFRLGDLIRLNLVSLGSRCMS